jgi:hypothetical protein
VVFPQGWQAARLSAGRVGDTPEADRLAEIARDALPAGSERLERLYGGRLKLAGYRLEPAQPRPGQALNLTLYWQKVQEMTRPVSLTVQLADSRSLSLGRVDLALPADGWLPGQVMPTRHTFPLSPELAGPLAGQVEVTLADPAQVALLPAGPAGEPLEAAVARFTIAPARWPDPARLADFRPVEAEWDNGIRLAGYTLAPDGRPLLLTLFWQAARPVSENYMVFVHLIDPAGQIRSQNDALPRAGAYPTPWWQPGLPVADEHPLALPDDLPPGSYRLVTGLYRPEAGGRLELAGGGDSLELGTITVP